MLISSYSQLQDADLQSGVTLLIDKPLTWTSFDVVNKLKFTIKNERGIKKIKIGHAGTLDPLATGLLIVAIGKDTKMINEYQELTKEYSGAFYIGATTISYDSEFEPDMIFPTDHIDKDLINLAKEELTGEIFQTPPIFSALKVDGQRSYIKARKGQQVELEKRKVKIYNFDITKIELHEIIFEVRCSKGTYIRSLAFDFGNKLQSGAYLKSLNRDAIGNFKNTDAFNFFELIDFFKK
jgi:tRNA pseudouridine55 synthase